MIGWMDTYGTRLDLPKFVDQLDPDTLLRLEDRHGTFSFLLTEFQDHWRVKACSDSSTRSDFVVVDRHTADLRSTIFFLSTLKDTLYGFVQWIIISYS